MRKFAEERQYLDAIVEAMKSSDENKIKQAWEKFHDAVVADVKQDNEEILAAHDSEVLAQRGYRQLTTRETKWYQKVIEALNSSNPKQAFTAIIASDEEDDLMPTTIIEDVYKNLREDYPLLKAINFQHVGYTTKWILHDHSTQAAVWGTITDEITKEITSAFRTVDIDQYKLSAFAVIEHGMLDLGPTFLDGYIRAVLTEALMAGLEMAIVAGTGHNEPIGLIRDISEGVSVNSSTGYPAKEAIAVKGFTPTEYGALVARLAKTEKGKTRKFAKVGLIVNMTDYLTKVMPATTVLNTTGHYVNNLFPFATEVYVSNAVDEGKAVLFLEDEYFLGMGGQKNGVIEYSDEYKFLEDQRVFKIKQYGMGRAFDNTSALYLDISGLEPAYIQVKQVEVTA